METVFLKFYVMGATGIDFGDIAHVKVGGHYASENIGLPYGGKLSETLGLTSVPLGLNCSCCLWMSH